jgi:acyl-CoA synthetase (AMP-forming)/AMP-acid ligase II
MMGNSVDHLQTMLACYKARAVPINVNTRYTANELAYLFDDADLVAIVHDDTTGRAQVAAGTRPCFTVAESDYARAATQRDLGPRSPDDHYVLYTGGTTGMPKGVVWRQEDIFFAALGGGNPGGPPIERPEQIAASVVDNPAQRLRPFLAPDDPGPPQFVSLALGPLMHASGQWSAFGTLLGGGNVVLYDDPHVDMTRVLHLVARERVGAMNIVGDASARPLLETLESDPQRWDTSSLVLLGSGGSILSGDLKDALLRVMPSVAAIIEGIGSSESPAQAVALTTRAGAPARSLTFSAKPETMVVDDELQPVPAGTVGRLATRGRVPIGYYKDEARSARTFVEIDGARWSLPGDMATIDADGTVHLLGRGSLCINTGGEKVYPEEVEAALKTHPTVDDAVVVGQPDARLGQQVVAIVASSAQPTLDELQEHCRATLAGYKLPRALFVVEAIRRSDSGKADYTWANQVAAST